MVLNTACVRRVNENRDLLILLLGSLPSSKEGKGETRPFKGAVKLVKAIFLAQCEMRERNLQPAFDYSFYRWDHGPFDSAIYHDLDLLQREGLVKQTLEDYGLFRERAYSLTKEGLTHAKKLREKISNNVTDTIGKWANWVDTKSREQVLEMVYRVSRLAEYQIGDNVPLPKVSSEYTQGG